MLKTKAGINRFYRLVGAVVLVLLIVWTLAPLYWMITTSFKETAEVYGEGVTLWPCQQDDENHQQREEHHVHGRTDAEAAGFDCQPVAVVRQNLRQIGRRAVGENVYDHDAGRGEHRGEHHRYREHVHHRGNGDVPELLQMACAVDQSSAAGHRFDRQRHRLAGRAGARNVGGHRGRNVERDTVLH